MVTIKSVLVVLIGLFYILLLIGSTIQFLSPVFFPFILKRQRIVTMLLTSNPIWLNRCSTFVTGFLSNIDFRYRKSTYIQFTNDSRIHSCYISIKVDVILTIRDIYNKINDVVIFCWYFSMIKRRYVQKNMAFFSPVPLKVKV